MISTCEILPQKKNVDVNRNADEDNTDARNNVIAMERDSREGK